MNCPECDAEMKSNGASGTQHTGFGVVTDVSVSWDECPECDTVVDDMGNTIPGDA